MGEQEAAPEPAEVATGEPGFSPGVRVVDPLDRYDSLIQYYAGLSGLPWQWIKRQMIVESAARPDAVSPSGAVGLMQFTVEAWREWGEGCRRNPEASIKAGCRLMAHLLQRYHYIPDPVERWRFALAAYNTGYGNVNKTLRLARRAFGHPESWDEWKASGSPAGEWQRWAFTRQFLPQVTGIHARETIRYVKAVAG